MWNLVLNFWISFNLSTYLFFWFFFFCLSGHTQWRSGGVTPGYAPQKSLLTWGHLQGKCLPLASPLRPQFFNLFVTVKGIKSNGVQKGTEWQYSGRALTLHYAFLDSILSSPHWPPSAARNDLCRFRSQLWVSLGIVPKLNKIKDTQVVTRGQTVQRADLTHASYALYYLSPIPSSISQNKGTFNVTELSKYWS